mmetsp:Transcript_16281/g.30220  ORF Transcript_16281/g.30220 Transcript_16281/m.30220 type:complete len:90 (-) Transcript_16281:790-1059(-)
MRLPENQVDKNLELDDLSSLVVDYDSFSRCIDEVFHPWNIESCHFFQGRDVVSQVRVCGFKLFVLWRIKFVSKYWFVCLLGILLAQGTT